MGWFDPVITYKASCSPVFLRLTQSQSLPATYEVRGLCGWGPGTLCLCLSEDSHRHLPSGARSEAEGKLQEHIKASLRDGRVWEAVSAPSTRMTAQDDLGLRGHGSHRIYENKMWIFFRTLFLGFCSELLQAQSLPCPLDDWCEYSPAARALWGCPGLPYREAQHPTHRSQAPIGEGSPSQTLLWGWHSYLLGSQDKETTHQASIPAIERPPSPQRHWCPRECPKSQEVRSGQTQRKCFPCRYFRTNLHGELKTSSAPALLPPNLTALLFTIQIPVTAVLGDKPGF